HSMANTYLEESIYFKFISTFNNNSEQQQQQHINEIIQSINSSLEDLHKKNLIGKNHLSKLKIIKTRTTNFNLPHLYFLPETHQVYLLLFIKIFNLYLLGWSYITSTKICFMSTFSYTN